jgi:hypothetical protein
VPKHGRVLSVKGGKDSAGHGPVWQGAVPVLAVQVSGSNPMSSTVMVQKAARKEDQLFNVKLR